MIFVDTSVWIDHFRGLRTPEVELLESALRQPASALLGDLVLLEILQGVSSSRRAALIERALLNIPTVAVLDIAIARQAAANYRTLRRHGVTPRRSADLIIGTWCIAHDVELLHRDRDYIPMQRHLGLRNHAAPAH